MQYLDALERLRSQGFPNKEVAVRRHEIMQRFFEGVRSFELKRNFALMYAPEQYVDTPQTVEALRFTVPQYLRMRGPAVPRIIQHPSSSNSNLYLQTSKSRYRQRPSKRLTLNLRSNLHSSLRLTHSNHSEHVLTVVIRRTL